MFVQLQHTPDQKLHLLTFCSFRSQKGFKSKFQNAKINKQAKKEQQTPPSVFFLLSIALFCLFYTFIYDDFNALFIFCKVTLSVIKGVLKSSVLQLIILLLPGEKKKRKTGFVNILFYPETKINNKISNFNLKF